MGLPISDLHGRMILDSRGNPTIEVDCYASIDIPSRSTVPSGASTGSYEAVELRDGGEKWIGKGVDLAIENINGKIKQALIGIDVSEQNRIDRIMIDLDNSANKSNLGANAILGTSLACLRAAAGVGYPLWSYIASEEDNCALPVPLMNILNGGAHANSNVDIQEFMIVPHGFTNFKDALRAGVEIYHTLKQVLQQNQLLSGVGDEGGFAPNLNCNEDGLIYVVQAIESAGYKPGKQVSIALDVAAQEFLKEDKYHFDGKLISGNDLANIYSSWIEKYPIVSIEDPFGEDDWDSWIEFTRKEGHQIQIVGDDLYVTNPNRLKRGIETSASNAILIKLNQIGTFSETMDVIKMAKDAGFATIISHRSGETRDDIISDIAVGTNAGQIKTGAPARSDRTSKYNQLLRISEKCEHYTQLF